MGKSQQLQKIKGMISWELSMKGLVLWFPFKKAYPCQFFLFFVTGPFLLRFALLFLSCSQQDFTQSFVASNEVDHFFPPFLFLFAAGFHPKFRRKRLNRPPLPPAVYSPDPARSLVPLVPREPPGKTLGFRVWISEKTLGFRVCSARFLRFSPREKL